MNSLLKTLAILAPFIDEIEDWLNGKTEEKPARLAALPETMQSELSLERMRRAAERA